MLTVESFKKTIRVQTNLEFTANDITKKDRKMPKTENVVEYTTNTVQEDELVTGEGVRIGY